MEGGRPPPGRTAKALLAAADGDVELAHELAVVFLEDLPMMLAKLRAAASAGNVSALRASAHTVKGASATLGFEEVALEARALEMSAPGGEMDAETVERHVEQLAAMCEEAQRAVRAYLRGDR
jgi:HPt (histidine-containing phosphotransfer) domain-containing protein